MARWLPKLLKRIHELAASEAVRLRYKAQREALLLGLPPEDVRDVIAGLDATDSDGRVASDATGEWMYVFKPSAGGLVVYVKLVLPEDCAVVSFHEDDGVGREEET